MRRHQHARPAAVQYANGTSPAVILPPPPPELPAAAPLHPMEMAPCTAPFPILVPGRARALSSSGTTMYNMQRPPAPSRSQHRSHYCIGTNLLVPPGPHLLFRCLSRGSRMEELSSVAVAEQPAIVLRLLLCQLLLTSPTLLLLLATPSTVSPRPAGSSHSDTTTCGMPGGAVPEAPETSLLFTHALLTRQLSCSGTCLFTTTHALVDAIPIA